MWQWLEKRRWQKWAERQLNGLMVRINDQRLRWQSNRNQWSLAEVPLEQPDKEKLLWACSSPKGRWQWELRPNLRVVLTTIPAAWRDLANTFPGQEAQVVLGEVGLIGQAYAGDKKPTIRAHTRFDQTKPAAVITSDDRGHTLVLYVPNLISA